MINFNNNNEENKNVVASIPPDVLFSPEFQNTNFHLRKAFHDFVHENYQQVDKIKEVTYSTNHVTYYFYQNPQNNDVRILRAESGCFSSNQKFVSLDFIEAHKKDLENERDIFVPKLPVDRREGSIEWCNNKINSVQNVLTKYKELTNNKISKPKI